MQQAETQVVEMATNLDDVPGEVVGAAVASLLAEPGVLDVWTTPIAMKKDRPGVMLSLLCERGAMEVVGRRMMEQTGTFGVRHRPWERMVLERRQVSVETPLGSVRVKVGTWQGAVVAAKPEFEDVQKLAKANGVSVRQAMAAARAAADELVTRKGDAG